VQTICIVGEGDLPIELSWSFRGDSETGMADLGISTTRVGPRSTVLQIDSVTAGHSGEYTCTAKNSVGSQSVSAHLEVLGTITSKSIRIASRTNLNASGLLVKN
jgi:hypothetical protein